MFKGRSAIVTGSTSGIGLGIAEALAVQGANVMLNGFGNANEIKKTRTRLEAEYGVRVTYSGADMSRPSEIATMVAEAERQLGGVDILINNAGIQHVSPVDAFPKDKWDQIIAINLSSSFHTIHEVLPGMKAKGWGRIVNIASVHGLVASVNKSAYVAAKHGVVGLTKVVALEVAAAGITCNAICPGFVQTPLIEKQIEEQGRLHGVSREEAVDRLLSEKQPAKKFVKIDEIAALALYLCSDAAASITGTAVSIDGGWTAQ